MPKALITGAAGQDGSYLADLLISKGYEVHGLVRPSGNRTYPHLKALREKGHIIWGDLLDPEIFEVLSHQKFDEVYHLGALSHVGASFENPALTIETNLVATSRLLAALHRNSPKTKFYMAGTSEMFGQNQIDPFKYDIDDTLFEPCSPYGVSKLACHHLSLIYRRLGMFVVRGLAYNHESIRRGEHFVTRKIGISLRKHGKVTLGNLSAKRDWHHAKDTVRGMWLAMQEPFGGDYVFASGVSRTVKDFAEAACEHLKLDFKKAVTISDSSKRPIDVEYLCGDYRRANQTFGWYPKISFKELVEECCQESESASAFLL